MELNVTATLHIKAESEKILVYLSRSQRQYRLHTTLETVWAIDGKLTRS